MNKTTFLELYLISKGINHWQAAINSNFVNIDEKFQELAEELYGSSTKPYGNLSILKDKLTEWEVKYSDQNYDAVKMGAQDILMHENYPTTVGQENLSGFFNQQIGQKQAWTSATGTPFSLAASTLTVDEPVYCGFGGKLFIIDRASTEFPVVDSRDYMIVASTYELDTNSNFQEKILSPERVTYKGIGVIANNRKYAKGIGNVSNAPQVGDIIQWKNKELKITAVYTDYVEFEDNSGGVIDYEWQPDDLILRSSEPYFGIVEYNEELLFDPNVIVLATIKDGDLGFSQSISTFLAKGLFETNMASAWSSTSLPLTNPGQKYLSCKNMTPRLYVTDRFFGGYNVYYRTIQSGGNYQALSLSIDGDNIHVRALDATKQVGINHRGTAKYTSDVDNVTVLTE